MLQRTSISNLQAALQDRSQTAVGIVEDSLDRIDRIDSSIHAFREIYAERALSKAHEIDRLIATGNPIPALAGVPVAIKDNIVTDFGTTTCGSRMLEHFQSPYRATVVDRLEHAGAIIIGKTNCDEFAMGSSTEHCAFGPTHNPWARNRVPGGSSGGSAAAIAAGLCPISLGSDTGGSIRQPAAMCGVVGVKPSYGRVSRNGLVAFGSSFDQIGPFANTVEDAAIVLGVLAGEDPHDSTCASRHVPDYLEKLDQPVADLRIGVPREFLSDHNDVSVKTAVQNAIATYASLGAEIVDIELPLTAYGIATYYVIAPAEASSNLARFDGVRYGLRAELSGDDDLFELYAKSRSQGFGPEVQRRVMLGTYVLSAGYYDAFYARALKTRRLIKQEFDRAFEQCHAIIGPTSPFPAFEIGATQDPISMYQCDIYTTNTSIAGICGMSIPCGFSDIDGQRLPIGLQVQCQAFDEATMLRVAKMFESATTYHAETVSHDGTS